ncbi:MAG: hydantoinase B/oxoprolinase family protein [Candidatus Nanopelagicales bacterium]|nr:hydantoinase B/oxoprolinase family protein [Candidatus Nanopelagicales bacterium]
MSDVKSYDNVELTLLNQNLVNICDEMAVSMMRTAYSPIFSEGLDFSTFILDANGDLVATAGLNPAMLGASLYAASWVIAEVGAANFNEGDIWIYNDPYRGGSHMPEHMMILPIYVDGSIAAYVGNIAHMAEIGGMAAGSFSATATDIYQEGLRLPPIKLFDRGEPVKDIWRIILANHRTPANSWGDLHAMLGSLYIGERRSRQLIEERGVERIRISFSQLQDFAERHIREEIRALPDGVYCAEDCFDDDGVGSGRYYIRLTMTIDGDRVVFDFTDSDSQAAGAINAPYVVTLSGALNGLLYSIGRRLPVNAGITRAVRVVAKAGTICNVQHPGACVGGQTEYQPKLIEMISSTILAQIGAERAAAGSGNTSLNFLFGGVHPVSKEYFAHYHFEGNGWGGRSATDGNSAQIMPHANCRNTPVEIFETRYPWLHHQYAMNGGTGGIGKYRGGLGVKRDIEVVGDMISVSVLADRGDVPPSGILGGGDGSHTEVLIKRAGNSDFSRFTVSEGAKSATKFVNVRLNRGDTVRLVSPSGGGYGDALQRDPEAVKEDVLDRFITMDQASEDYGVVLTEELDVDQASTEKARRSRS